MARPTAVVLIMAGWLVATITPAWAHVVVGSVFARPPVCRPDCRSADSIRFHARIRLDDCNADPCPTELALSGWAEVRTRHGWRPIRRSIPRTEVLTPGAGFGIEIVVPCDRFAGSERRFRMEALGGVVGDHRFVTNTPNPDFSAPVPVRCRDGGGRSAGPDRRFRGSLYARIERKGPES